MTTEGIRAFIPENRCLTPSEARKIAASLLEAAGLPENPTVEQLNAAIAEIGFTHETTQGTIDKAVSPRAAA